MVNVIPRPSLVLGLILALLLALPATAAFAGSGDPDVTDPAIDLNPAVVVLVSALMPVLMSIIIGVAWTAPVKALISFIVIVAIGVLVAWLTDHWTKLGVLETCAAVWALSSTFYMAIYKSTGADAAIERSIFPQDGHGAKK